ncbi:MULTISPECIES: VPA1267 family protein [unclassified Marinobacterium]|uniref:VPA1267 family protein n=1 Tax=unclassified Marinobacterium TaxID=2644139 RepID=UPI001568FC9C|nr:MULTISPECIES: VPA1267 family protein [unclassified Marinobacterium]NRP10376.1 hypothetical protein [Marinobacterium sp. xm-g-48]NRP83475.1 hypothetical protein [Marinobacterium sp. xm-d-509]
MSQDKGDKYVSMFRAWMSSMDDDGYTKIAYRGKLNKAEINKLSGVSMNSLKKNPVIIQELAELEESLRVRGVLPPLTEEGKAAKDAPKQYDSTSIQKAFDRHRLGELEATNHDLRAQVAVLEEKVRALEAKLATSADLIEAIDELEVFRLCPSK